MGPIIVALAVGAAAVAVYEWWLKPEVGAGTRSDAGTGIPGAVATPALRLLGAGMLNATQAQMQVPVARAWVLRVASAYNISPAGDSLVQALLYIARTLGRSVVPVQFQQLANYGLATQQDWPLRIVPLNLDFSANAGPYYQPRSPGR